MKEEIKQFWKEHRGKIVWCTIFLILAILILTINFWRTLLIVVMVSIGYFIASRETRLKLLTLLDRMLPKIFRR
ncbi:MAG: DUF2273 domain-containing protein [Bacillota bacterium]|nr:DUF2273 domain-containing protein [Bacillota bacterium]